MKGKGAVELFQNGKPPIVTPHKYEGLGKQNKWRFKKTFTTTIQNGGLRRYEVYTRYVVPTRNLLNHVHICWCCLLFFHIREKAIVNCFQNFAKPKNNIENRFCPSFKGFCICSIHSLQPF